MSTEPSDINDTRAGSDADAGGWRRLVVPILAALYVLSPLDLVPDVPIVGWIDDLLVVLAAGIGTWRSLRGDAGGRYDGLWVGVTRVLWALLALLLCIALVATLA